MGDSELEIYPVGLLGHLKLFASTPDRSQAFSRLRYDLRYPARQARARNWRAVRSYFNGYLAEHPSLGTRAGHGWTKRRAERDLMRHLHYGA